MKKDRRGLISLLAILVVLLSFTSCDWFDDDDDNRIMSTMNKEGNLDTLITAIEAADLDDDLKGEGPFTIFAPTDDAFDALPAGILDTLLEPSNQSALIDLLSFHVYSGELTAADVTALSGTSINMLNGSDLRIDVVNPVILSLRDDSKIKSHFSWM